jgi:hypothetical protein
MVTLFLLLNVVDYGLHTPVHGEEEHLRGLGVSWSERPAPRE